MEGDEKNRAAKKWWGISIHALRVEGDMPVLAYYNIKSLPFLSTPSGWRATDGAENEQIEYLFLSTPSGWRATEH